MIGNVLKNSKTLQHLTLKDSLLYHENPTFICEGLQLNQTLYSLTLHLNLNLPKNMLKNIFGALEYNATLKKLRIYTCKIQPIDI